MTCGSGVVYESLFDQMYWAVQSPCNTQWYAALLGPSLCFRQALRGTVYV